MKPFTYKWTIEDGIAIACSGPGEMPSNLWNKYIADLKRHPISKTLGLNLGPVTVTSTQRKEVGEILKMKGCTSAVVTDDRIVRGIITAVSWFGSDVEAFAWADLSKAITFLKVPTNLETRVRTRALDLRRLCELEIGESPR